MPVVIDQLEYLMPKAETLMECPKCGAKFPLTDVLLHPIEDRLRGELERKAVAREREMTKREQALVNRELEIDKEVSRQLEAGQKKLVEATERKVREKVTVELQDKDNELGELRAKALKADEAQLELRRKERAIEEERQHLRVELEEKLDAERPKLLAQAETKIANDRDLERRQYDQRIRALVGQLEEAKRAAEQTPGQLKGEVQELALEDLLRQTFRFDEIQPVPKGEHGADVLQVVKTPGGRELGVIIWESKRTKKWNPEWLTKLRQDQRDASADLSVLISQSLPEGIPTLALIEGVVVGGLDYVLPIGMLLRARIEEVSKARQANLDRGEKEGILYSYINSKHFIQAIQDIAEAFVTSKRELERERTALTRIWRRREIALVRGVQSVAEMYGTMQGIVGSSLPTVPILALTDGEGGAGADQKDPMGSDDEELKLPPKGPLEPVEKATIESGPVLAEPVAERLSARVSPKEVSCIKCKHSVPLTDAEVLACPMYSSKPKAEWLQLVCPDCSTHLAIAWRDAARSKLVSIRA